MPFLAAINAGFTNTRVISPGGGGGAGGGGSSETLVANSVFVAAIASASDSNHTYSMASTNISGDFADMRRIATNGTYTIVGDPNIAVNHTGAGTTGTNQQVSGCGWIWIVRNSDGAIVKSCNSILNGDHDDSGNIEQQTRGGVASTGTSANIGYSVAINDNYAFTFAGFRLSGSETSENFDDHRAYLFAYDLSDFSLAKVWKVNDFYTQIDHYSGGPAYSSFGSGFGEHGMFATNNSLYIPSGYTAHVSNGNYPGGAVSYFDLSDANPSNWTNPTVFKTPLAVNTTTSIGGSNYSNGNFGASGVYVYDTQVLVTHATRVHNYTRSGTSFSETSVYTPAYYVGENYNIPLSTGKVAMVTGDQSTKTLTVRDPANSWSQEWQVTLPGNGFPGYNVLIDAANDKLFTSDNSHDGNGTDDGLITVYDADGTVNQTINNPVSTNTRFGSGYSVHNGKLAAKVRVGGVSTDLAIQFMDVPSYNPGGSSPSADGWQANTIISNSSSGGGPSFGIRGVAGLSDGGVFVSGNEGADDIGFVMLTDTDGDVQWVKQLNANAYYARFYSASANGTSLFATGNDFGWGANEAAAGRTNVGASIAAKFAKSDGSVDWMKVIKKTSIGSVNDGFDTSISNSVADSDGNLWLIGRYKGTNTASNLHIAKINGSNGALMSMHKRTKSPDTKQDNIYGMKLDASGNIYLLWQVYDPSSSNTGVGVQKLNSSFVIQWTKMFSATTNNNDTPYQFVLDSSGNVYVSGTTEQNPGSAFIAKLNTADGTIAWSKQLNTGTNPGTGVDQAKGMVVDNDGNIWLCGPYGPATPYNFVLTKYNSSGVIQNQWGIAGGNGYTLYNSINTMDIDGNGNVLLGFQMSKSGSARTSIFKLPATLEAGTFTDLVITDRTAVDYTYSPSNITHTTYSMSDVTSDFETANYNSGSYALLPIFTNTFTKDVDPIT